MPFPISQPYDDAGGDAISTFGSAWANVTGAVATNATAVNPAAIVSLLIDSPLGPSSGRYAPRDRLRRHKRHCKDALAWPRSAKGAVLRIVSAKRPVATRIPHFGPLSG